ncbi:MAG: hypothetical protein U0236_06460 [Nitrospira sp.]
MRVTNMMAVGFLAVVAATGVVSEGHASDASSVDGVSRLGVGGATYSARQPMPDGAGVCQMKADVIERIGAGGSTYSSSQSMTTQEGDCPVTEKRVDTIERIGHGGSTYSFRQPMSARAQ